jgi:hypothetical protein
MLVIHEFWKERMKHCLVKRTATTSPVPQWYQPCTLCRYPLPKPEITIPPSQSNLLSKTTKKYIAEKSNS